MTEAAPNKRVLDIARGEVRRLLTDTPAFRELSPEARKDLAHNMVKIASYIAGGVRGESTPTSAVIAKEATASDDMARSGAAAAEQGSEVLADSVQKVDFPAFVAGLIDGVFNAIVESSVKQMEAYAELVKNVAKSVDDFMKDNVTENQARDYLADKYPEHLELDLGAGTPTLKPKPGLETGTMPNFFQDLGLPNPMTTVDDQTVEQELVPAARRRLAMDRQQLLATMVLMGINRLIVTDGSIKASVVFDLNTRDTARQSRSGTRTTNFQENTTSGHRPGIFGIFRGYRTVDRTAQFTAQTVNTDSASSESTVDLKTKLAGEVNLRFRSETFPLDKMTELIQPDLKEKLQPKRAAAAAAPGQPPPAPPPPPQLPPITLPPAPGASRG
ncbi:MAG: hypothetical protein HOW73_23975 [Polyangiaceae bacterium]|nr:hypothetical protein [Polyangiaceae bacterium]